MRNNKEFDQVIMDGMRKALAEDYGEKFDQIKVASAKKETKRPSKMAELISELVACADQLDALGHPLASEVDATLAEIEQELMREDG